MSCESRNTTAEAWHDKLAGAKSVWTGGRVTCTTCGSRVKAWHSLSLSKNMLSPTMPAAVTPIATVTLAAATHSHVSALLCLPTVYHTFFRRKKSSFPSECLSFKTGCVEGQARHRAAEFGGEGGVCKICACSTGDKGWKGHSRRFLCKCLITGIADVCQQVVRCNSGVQTHGERQMQVYRGSCGEAGGSDLPVWLGLVGGRPAAGQP